MLRVKDRKKIDVISNASEIEDGHRNQKGWRHFATTLLIYPVLLRIARGLL
jgi:hypothetical protein